METLASLATSFMVTLVDIGGENFTASSDAHEASCERSCKPDKLCCQSVTPRKFGQSSSQFSRPLACSAGDLIQAGADATLVSYRIRKQLRSLAPSLQTAPI